VTGIAPFDPVSLAIMAATNPVVVGVGFAMGTRADQWQKIPVAAFVASIVGCLFVWLASLLGLVSISGHGGMAGLFMAQFVPGLIWAAAGYYFARRSGSAS